jgi:hypothetical protein
MNDQHTVGNPLAVGGQRSSSDFLLARVVPIRRYHERKWLPMIEVFEAIENENEVAFLANNNVAPEIEFGWDED